MKIKHPLSKKEVRQIVRDMEKIFGKEVTKKLISKNDQVLIGEFDKKTRILFVNKRPRFIKRENLIFPLVIALYEISNLEDLRTWKRRVVVDQGAVPYILNGADVMAPGIVDVDEEVKEGDFVFIVEEEYGRPLAIGISLLDGKTMKEKKKGKAVKVIHHAKDKIWELTAL